MAELSVGVRCGVRRVRAGSVPRAVRLVVAGVLGILPAAPPAVAAVPASNDGDVPKAFTMTDSRITESSGLAASRAHRDVYWTHNDSDDGPFVYAVDGRTGKTAATVTLQGIQPRDVEAVSVGPDGDVYVADIGDNRGGTWPEVWIYRFPEPESLRNTTVTPVRYTVRYADGPRDAESVMVHPETGRVYVASKEGGDAGVYAAPETLSASGVNTFRRVGNVRSEATDAAFSPDGTRLLVRTYFGAQMYRWKDGAPETLGSVPVPFQGQGESVTFSRSGRALMCGAEGADSRVEPVELDGALLPENVARDDAGTGSDPSGSPGSSGGGEDGKSGDGKSGDGRGEDGDNREVAVGGVTFLVAVAVWLGLRRLFRRGD